MKRCLLGAALLSAVSPALVGPEGKAHAGSSDLRVRAASELPVTPMDQRAAYAHNSPAIIPDPADERILVLASRLDNPDFGCSLHVSGDGGSGWLPSPIPALPEGADKCYGPEIAFDSKGRLKFLFVGLAGRGNNPTGAFLATATDEGYGPVSRVLGPRRYMVRMAIDPSRGPGGRMHLVWLEAGADSPVGGLPQTDNPIMAAYSDDDGKTFSRPVRVSDPHRTRAVAPALALGPNGSVHVAYYDLREDFRDYQGLEGPAWEGNWSLVVSSSKDAGRSFGPGVVVDRMVVPPERVMLIFTMPPPSLTTDPDGNVFVSWHDARNGDWDAFLSSSTTAGAKWSPAKRLNDDPLSNGRHQHMPKVSASSNGRLDALFYDRRNDSGNQKADVYLTSSTNSGKSFGANTRLTKEPSDTMVGPRYPIPSATGLVEFGSRIALFSNPRRALAAWTDTRNSFSDSFQQEVYATRLDFSGNEGVSKPSAASVLAAGAVGVLALGAFYLAKRRRRLEQPGAEVA